jgi:hypothetical protein
MYTAVCSADLWEGGDHRTYALQIVQWMYVGPPDLRYFLEYLLGNTWMYKTPFGPMCKDHWTFARIAGRPLGLPDVRCSVRELMANFPP